MFMYLVNILLLIVYAAVLLWIRPTKVKKKLFCALAAGNWILLSGLRHASVGADTYVYQRAFYNSKYVSWHSVWENFKNTFFRWDVFSNEAANEGADLFDVLWNSNELAVKDPGYAIVNKAFYSVIPDYTAFLFFIALVFMIPLAILIYRHSREPLMSFIIYSCLFYSFFSITGHRQTLATGIALIGYLAFAEKKKFLPFLLTVLLAYPLHKSVLGFIGIYFLQNLKMDRKKVIGVLCLFPIVFIFRSPLVKILSYISGYEPEAAKGYAVTFLLVYILLMIVSLWKGEEALRANKHANTSMGAVAVAFLLTPLTFVNPIMMRLLQYYSLFLVLFVPDLVMSLRKEECVFAYFSATAVVVLLMFKNNPQYLFFWQ